MKQACTGSETKIRANAVRSGQEKRTLLCLTCLNPVQRYEILGLRFNTYFVQASSVQGTIDKVYN